MKITIIILMLVLLVFPIVSADVIMPGYKTISIQNKISNIGDFPNHMFILGPSLENPGPLGLSVQLVEEDGVIPGQYYKFASPSVFAIEKDKWDEEKMQKFMDSEIDPFNSQESYEEYIALMESMDTKEVISGLINENQVPESSTVELETKTFTIDLNKVKTEPDDTEKEVDYLKTVIYVLIALIVLIIIIAILVKRKNG